MIEHEKFLAGDEVAGVIEDVNNKLGFDPATLDFGKFCTSVVHVCCEDYVIGETLFKVSSSLVRLAKEAKGLVRHIVYGILCRILTSNNPQG